MVGATGRGRANRFLSYTALPSQRRFHWSRARFKGFSGPVGSGKSQALCREALMLAYANPGRQGLIGAPTYPMLRDATVATLQEVLAEAQIPHTFNKAEHKITLRDTGSVILLRAVDEYERLRGTNLAWFGLDELTYTAEESWLRLEARLRDPKAQRLCGFAVWTPKGFDWVYRRFVSGSVEGYETILAPPQENRHLLEKIPDFYERLKRSYDARFYEQEVLGQYVLTGTGRVYEPFHRERNVRPLALDPLLPLFWALDFNVDPMASVVAQVKGDEVRVLDEIVLSRATTMQACEEFTARFGGFTGPVEIHGDASGHARQTTGASDYGIISDYFRRRGFGRVTLQAQRANPAVRDRVQLMNAKLANAEDETTLLIDPKCRELIRDLEEVAFQEGTQAIDKDRDPRRTHVSDALGYLVWDRFGRREQAGYRPERLF